MAVVHADGNGMGQRIRKLLQGVSGNRKQIDLLREFSNSSHQAAATAIEKIKEDLQRNSHQQESGKLVWFPVGATEEMRKRLPQVVADEGKLPFREIITGGDDVTFVTDGLLGLSLAKLYLDYYREQLLADGKPAIGRAGIAIVNTHYPFAQAYALAESLAGNAKKAGQDGTEQSIDWHFAVNGLTRSLAELRKQVYTVPAGSLHTRPKQLGVNADQVNSWAQFETQLQIFQSDTWLDQRGKLKGLMPVLRRGKEMVAAHRVNYGLKELPQVNGKGGNGWLDLVKPNDGTGLKDEIETVCASYDAIEAADFTILLNTYNGGGK